ncbi:Low temperature viability protein [Massariosphaeria phaeospora]|uniref:Low temperature viability protein n=1 Tax=Massariosphaeria phaeospora TaxID=100035 RepID=A0A7C8HZN7_9PLEO|nr:Low temperature viability protein [Massariosphaeria phaeospora]
MPRRKFIDKKTASHFRLVNRAQDDPRIHDADAPEMVFTEVGASNMRQTSEPATSSRASQYSSATGHSKVKSKGDLDDEFGLQVRQNEGEAANHGVFYDDTEYDYMQHMRDLGSGGGEAYWVDAPSQRKGKGKEKFDLADALRAASLGDRQSDAGVSVSSSISRSASDVFGGDLAPSEFVRRTTYQDQQNVPDAIAGFQPDMDPRLREVLEALEDEAYVDDEDVLFNELTQGDGIELDPREWEDTDFPSENAMDRYLQDEEDPGWETDDTIKASSPPPNLSAPTDPSTLPHPDAAPAPAPEGEAPWMRAFKDFKSESKTSKPAAAAPPKPIAASQAPSSILSGASALTNSGRKKKRKGALTSTSSYSMTSSALHRTEGLTLLDQRFDRIEEEYAADAEEDMEFPDDASMLSGMSKMSGLSKMSGMSNMSGMSGVSNASQAPELRSDFDSIMDDFLGTHSLQPGKRRIRKGAPQTGLQQLEEVRKGLGPARVKTQKA